MPIIRKKIFVKEYNSKVHNFDEFFSVGMKLLSSCIGTTSALAAEVINNIRELNITSEEFLKTARSSGDIDLDKYLIPLYKTKESVKQLTNEVKSYRKAEREIQDLTKTRSTYGKAHGVAGWLFDGAIDLVADAVRGAGHMYTDSQDEKKIEKFKQELFSNTPISGEPNMSAYIKNIVEMMCMEVFSGVRPIIGQAPFFNLEDFQNSLDIIKKFENYRPISTDEIINGIFRQPYEIKLYYILLDKNEDSYSDLLKLAEFTGLEEKFADHVSGKINDWKKKAFNANKAGDPQTALKYYTLAAQNGDTDSMILLGSKYEEGKGVSRNESQAIFWYEKAANAGDATAMFLLGSLWFNRPPANDGENYKKSFKWFKKSAEKGNADSMEMLGLSYRRGKGVPVDSQKAIYWYKKAIDAGKKDAEKNLAEYKDELLQIEEDSLNGDDLLKRARSVMNFGNYKVALRCYEKSAARNNTEAMFELAKIYEEGNITPTNSDKAFKLYLKAAESGISSAMVKVANCYAVGQNVEKNFSQALEWYKKAADSNNVEAMVKLATEYECGENVTQDKELALELYLKASNLGNVTAIIKIAQEYEAEAAKVTNNVTDNIIILKKALNFYQKAVELNGDSNLKLDSKIKDLQSEIDKKIKIQAEEKIKNLNALKGGMNYTASDKKTNEISGEGTKINTQRPSGYKADKGKTTTVNNPEGTKINTQRPSGYKADKIKTKKLNNSDIIND